jgi:hypothetical protein
VPDGGMVVVAAAEPVMVSVTSLSTYPTMTVPDVGPAGGIVVVKGVPPGGRKVVVVTVPTATPTFTV